MTENYRDMMTALLTSGDPLGLFFGMGMAMLPLLVVGAAFTLIVGRLGR